MSTYRALPGSGFKVVCIEATSRSNLLNAVLMAEELIDAIYGVENVYCHRGEIWEGEGFSRILTLEF